MSIKEVTMQRQNAKISKQLFPEKEYRGLSPNFHLQYMSKEEVRWYMRNVASCKGWIAEPVWSLSWLLANSCWLYCLSFNFIQKRKSLAVFDHCAAALTQRLSRVNTKYTRIFLEEVLPLPHSSILLCHCFIFFSSLSGSSLILCYLFPEFYILILFWNLKHSFLIKTYKCVTILLSLSTAAPIPKYITFTSLLL